MQPLNILVLQHRMTSMDLTTKKCHSIMWMPLLQAWTPLGCEWTES